MASEHDSETSLRPVLGLASCTILGVGVILGAGIYVVVGKAAGLAGNALWISFLVASSVATLTALSYAELASFIPRAGGEYHYALRAFGARTAFLVSWLLLGGLSIAAGAVALGFGGYFEAVTGFPAIPGAVAAIAMCAALLAYGIRESTILAGLCTALEVLGLLAIIVFGVPFLGSVDLLETPHGFAGVSTAALVTFFAFIGFEEIVQLAEETENPTRTLPRALILSLLISTVLYLMVAVAAVSILDWQRLGASDSPLADVAERAVGAKSAMIIAIIALFSTFNTVLVLLMSAARLLWGVAEDGALPAALARVLPEKRSPWIATLIVASMAVAVAMIFQRIETVAELTNFALFVAFLFVNGAVIVLRFREPHTERPFRIPGSIGKVPLIPLLGALSVLALMSQISLLTAVLGVLLASSGLAAHWALARLRSN